MKKIILFLIIFSMNLLSIEKGSNALEFEIEDFEGNIVKLSDYKGKVVLIDFWASWCSPCKKAIPELDKLQKKYNDKGLVILGINLDERKLKAEKFLEKLQPTPSFIMLYDEKQVTPSLYKIEGMPTSIIIDKKGKIRFSHKGFSESTKSEYENEIELLLGE